MAKKYQIIQPKHGYFRGGVRQANISPTIDTGIGKWHFLIGETEMAKEIKCEQVGTIVSGGFTEMTGRIYGADGLSPTIRTVTGGNTEVKILEPLALDEQNGYIRKDGTVGTLTTDGSTPKHNNRVVDANYRIRKLTPRETFRLMDFSDNDFDMACYGEHLPQGTLDKIDNRIMTKAEWYSFNRWLRTHKQVMSNTQLWKQAGNSIVVNVLIEIFKQML